ncbi:hypothetical protein MACJ_003094 [Theileria orientalis]|uniref:Core domain-containing protein n=1 Tax=Theileria orientalis TaxID=68886 RepID=A0A976M7D7_THEOR|nr:hypothetical protein MACJ_003094 [Theileria orientalis]
MFTRLFRNVVLSHLKHFKTSTYTRKYSTDLTHKFIPIKDVNLRRSKRKDIVTLSQKALSRLYEIISNTNKVVYLCLRVKGCNGYVYEMKLVEDSKLNEMDERVYDKEGKLVLAIENKAAFYLLGSNIDYGEDELSEGFTFDNPNVTSKCGCGKSFKF